MVNKTKYFLLRLSYEVGKERPKSDLREIWARKMKKLNTNRWTPIVTPWAPDEAK